MTTAPRDIESAPRGFARLERDVRVRSISFEQAAADLLAWRVHERAGLRVTASDVPAREGTLVELRLGIGPFAISAPCTVLTVIDEPDRRGFRYGTLEGHPESGIEEFTVCRAHDGTVTFRIEAVSRPARWYSRICAPLARLVQERITSRYLRALSGR
ncbi:DUF1990 family protein [Brachybacterium sp. GCM10030267]|uniref:DUF1990 family protein n=1 Tax=Brachybacterium sp. GCM10030267 TaxID=3273381 RepID=UPI00361ADF7B